MAKINIFAEAARMRAYRENPNDTAAARQVGVKPATFSNWRTSRGLPPKYPHKVPRGLHHGRHPEPLKVLRALSVAKRFGKSEAMRRLGVHRNIILKWEKEFGEGGPGRQGIILAAMRQRRDDRFVEDSLDEIADVRAELDALLSKQAEESAWAEKRAEMRGEGALVSLK